MARCAGANSCAELKRAISNSLEDEGLPFQEFFSSEKISNMMSDVIPEWRDRVFSP